MGLEPVRARVSAEADGRCRAAHARDGPGGPRGDCGHRQGRPGLLQRWVHRLFRGPDRRLSPEHDLSANGHARPSQSPSARAAPRAGRRPTRQSEAAGEAGAPQHAQPRRRRAPDRAWPLGAHGPEREAAPDRAPGAGAACAPDLQLRQRARAEAAPSALLPGVLSHGPSTSEPSHPVAQARTPPHGSHPPAMARADACDGCWPDRSPLALA